MNKKEIFESKLTKLKIYITLNQKKLAKTEYKSCFVYFQNNNELGTELFKRLDELKEELDNLYIEK